MHAVGMRAHACAVLAACGGSGVDIRVQASPGVTRVDVFIAPEECTEGNQVATCDTGIAWDLTNAKQHGKIFILDVDATTMAKPLEDGSFRLDLQAEVGTTGELARMMFVGYGDQLGGERAIAAKRFTKITLPTDHAERWNVVLDPVGEILPGQVPSADALHFWLRDSRELARCIVGEQWSDGQLLGREFLVPPGDTDCDGLTHDAECDPYWWNAPGNESAIENASCSTNQYAVPGATGNSCLLGGAATCIEDTSGSNSQCAPVSPLHCLPDKVCDGVQCPDLRTCIDATPNPKVAAIVCTFPYDDTRNPCPGTARAEVDLKLLVQNTTRTCAKPRFSPLSPMPMFVDAPYTDGTTTFDPILIDPSINPCGFSLTWQGAPPAGLSNNRIYTWIELAHENGTFSVLPLRASFYATDCAFNPISQCQFIKTQFYDGVQACARVP